MATEFLSPAFRRQFFSHSTPIISLAFGLGGLIVGNVVNVFSSGAFSLGACLGWGFALGCLFGVVVTAVMILEKNVFLYRQEPDGTPQESRGLLEESLAACFNINPQTKQDLQGKTTAPGGKSGDKLR